ncbi:MAG: hypothetical protein ABI721_00955 [Candidatus Dojkabacteria bacterium]
MDINYIDLFEEDHFGDTFKDIVSEVNNNESAFVYGVAGTGVQTLLQQISHVLKKEIKVFQYKAILINEDPVGIISNDLLKLTNSNNLNDFIANLSEKILITISDIQDITAIDVLFSFLETLRKSSSYKLVYILGTDHLIFRSVKKVIHSQTPHAVHRLGMFDLKGTIRNIKINSNFFNYNIPEKLFVKIYELSGGHSRLTKYICKVLFQSGFDKLDDIEFLANNILIEPILNYLLELIITFSTKELIDLGILKEENVIFSTLLKYKLENFEIPNLNLIFNNLTSKEGKVFSYLFLNKDKIVSAEKIDFILNLVGFEYSLWASYKAINRLKLKIAEKFDLVNIKGKGYVLKSKVSLQHLR